MSSSPWCPALPADDDILEYLSLLESRAPPLFQTSSHDPLTPTHLALTHLLHPHRRRCPCCRRDRYRFRTAPPSFHAVQAMARLTVRRLGVMSQRRLLQYLHPIIGDWLCRKCRPSKSNAGRCIEKQRIAMEWVRELRRVVAMLRRRDQLQDNDESPAPHPPIDLTRASPPTSPSSSSSDDDMCCMICTDAIATLASAKACIQCGRAIHKTCFDQYAAFEDLNQEASTYTECAVLNLACIYCRCIVRSVPRSEAGKRAWEERILAREMADMEYARRVWEAEEEERVALWGVPLEGEEGEGVELWGVQGAGEEAEEAEEKGEEF